MRKFLLIGSILGLLSPAAHAAPATVADYALRAEQVAPGVYAVVSPARDFPAPENKGWNSNTGFVVTRDGVLVIDTGSSETIGRALRQVIASVTDQPVRWIINTHSHADHWLGNAALATDKTEIISSSTVSTLIHNDGPEWVERFNRMTEGATGASRVVSPNKAVDTRSTLQFGGLAVELIPSDNGHSPGDLIIWLPRQRVVFGGDVLYVQRAPATFDSNIEHWIRSLKQIEALKPAVAVPGHGPVANGEAVVWLRSYLEDLWRVVARGYADHQTDFEILPKARESMARHAKQFPDLDRRLGESVSHTYLQVEAAAFK